LKKECLEREQRALAPGAEGPRRARVLAASMALAAGLARGASESADALQGPLPLLAILGAFCGPAGIYRERTFEAASINPRITSPA
jgi:hypothetical protein